MFFVSPVQFIFDDKKGEVIRASKQDVASSVWKAVKALAMLSVLLGLVIHFDFEVFPRKEIKTFWDLFYWRNLCNNYVMACKSCSNLCDISKRAWPYTQFPDLTGIGLESGTRVVGTLIEVVTGNKVIELSDNPMTHSTSPSDFWGRRWNSLVHIVLKGAIYIPLRKNGFSKGIAALATFAGSGLLHEYVLTAIALKGAMPNDKNAHLPKYGNHLAFFAWNGVVLMLEGLFYKHAIIQKVKTTLPDVVITAMVIMTVLPIGHWFTGMCPLWFHEKKFCLGAFIAYKYILCFITRRICPNWFLHRLRGFNATTCLASIALQTLILRQLDCVRDCSVRHPIRHQFRTSSFLLASE